MRTEWCNHHNRNVTLEECVRCRFLCSYNPSAHQSGLWDMELVGRWGSEEIERYRESRKGVVE